MKLFPIPESLHCGNQFSMALGGKDTGVTARSPSLREGLSAIRALPQRFPAVPVALKNSRVVTHTSTPADTLERQRSDPKSERERSDHRTACERLRLPLLDGVPAWSRAYLASRQDRKSDSHMRKGVPWAACALAFPFRCSLSCQVGN